MLDRHWKFHPALKLALPFAAGIALARLAEPSPGQLMILLCCTLALLLLGMIRERIGVVIPMFATIILCGALHYALRAPSPVDRLAGASVRDAELIGRVAGEPVLRANRIDIPIECDSIIYRSSVAHPATTVLLRLYDTTQFDPALLPRHGDHISAVGLLTVPSPPGNPGEFDYAAYLGAYGIDITFATSRARTIQIFERDDLTLLERIVLPMRRVARDFTRRYVRGEEGDIVRALLLGEREYIDPETRDLFMRTGTVHVLSVSGLHVGVIALALFVTVSWIQSRSAQLFIFLVTLGLYTVVAGGGASIVRASLMAAAFVIARSAHRIPRPLNTLGVAALLILLMSPGALFDVGCQLSFASMAGIVLLYGRGEHALTERIPLLRRHYLLRYPMQALLLTASAQIFTLPLILYHFGYLSLISFIINIPVIPLFSIALGAAAAGAIAMPLVPALASWLGGSAYMAVRLAELITWWGGSSMPTGVDLGTVAAPGCVLLGIGVLYLSFARTVRQAMLRSVAFVLLGTSVLLADHLLDPLRHRDALTLALIPARHGIVAARVLGDSITIYGAARSLDSGLLRHTGEALRKRVGAVHVRAVRIDSIDAIAHGEILTINDHPREVAPHGMPVILSMTTRRPLGIVEAGGEKLLQVPLGMKLEEAVVLRHDRGWKIVDWR